MIKVSFLCCCLLFFIDVDDVSSSAAAIISLRGIVHTLIVDFLRFVGLFRGVSLPLVLFFFTGFFFFSSAVRSFVIQYDFFAVFKSSWVWIFAYRRWARTSCMRESNNNNKFIPNRDFFLSFSLIKCDRSGISRFETKKNKLMEWGKWRQYGN